MDVAVKNTPDGKNPHGSLRPFLNRRIGSFLLAPKSSPAAGDSNKSSSPALSVVASNKTNKRFTLSETGILFSLSGSVDNTSVRAGWRIVTLHVSSARQFVTRTILRLYRLAFAQLRLTFCSSNEDRPNTAFPLPKQINVVLADSSCLNQMIRGLGVSCSAVLNN